MGQKRKSEPHYFFQRQVQTVNKIIVGCRWMFLSFERFGNVKTLSNNVMAAALNTVIYLQFLIDVLKTVQKFS